MDYSDWSINPLTLAPGTGTIEGLADTFIININKVNVEVIYDGTTWKIYASVGNRGYNGSQGVKGFVGSGAGTPGTVVVTGTPIANGRVVRNAANDGYIVANPAYAAGVDIVAGTSTTLRVTPKAIADANAPLAVSPISNVIDLSTVAARTTYTASITATVTIGPGSYNRIKGSDVIRLWIKNDSVGREIKLGAGIVPAKDSPTSVEYAVANTTALFVLQRGPFNEMICVPGGIFFV